MRGLVIALFVVVGLVGLVSTSSAARPTLVVLTQRPEGDQSGPRASAASADRVVKGAGVAPGRLRAPQIGMLTVRPANDEPLDAAIARLKAQQGVVSVRRNRQLSLRYAPADPALSAPELAPRTPSGTVRQWWIRPLGLLDAWDMTRGDRALVAVIDTGVDGGHPELAPKIRDAINLDATQSGAGATSDQHGHGTHVASLACAQADNQIAIAGAGLGCGLLVIKSDLTDASVAAGIVEAVDRGAHAINMSFGSESGSSSDALRRAIDYAVARNVVLVAAAADDPVTEQGYPANMLQPTGTASDLAAGRGLSVTAVTAAGTRAPFAGYGSQISLAAYGSYGDGAGPRGLLGAFPAGQTDLEKGDRPCQCRIVLDGDDRYAYLEGTSMAAPLVTAVAALVRDLNPDLSLPETLRLLKETARRSAPGWNRDTGWGIVDGAAALRVAASRDRTAPTSRARLKRGRRDGVTVTVTARDVGPLGVFVSGVKRYALYRTLPGERQRNIATRTSPSFRVRQAPRGTAFSSVAIDAAGNHETVPKQPDVRVR